MSLIPSNFFSGFDDFFMTPYPRTNPFLTSPTMITTFADDIDKTLLRRASPRYEITEDDKQFQLAVDIPGVKATDMKVQVEHGGRVLHLSGQRKTKERGVSTESRFEKAFTIDDTIDTGKIRANLSDGVLVVTAPKKPKESTAKIIAITKGDVSGVPMEEDKKED
mmetsp:Transcript_61131/g.180815  ORF Transcript_61131/g.180815 Transcript_61131/m.180815 type:complete len:165 (-) Transcript_61131:121-615(-)